MKKIGGNGGSEEGRKVYMKYDMDWSLLNLLVFIGITTLFPLFKRSTTDTFLSVTHTMRGIS